MGASTFTTTATGKTAAEAYRRACESAREENGHQDGYSGDIQTTSGFVMIAIPPRTRDAGRRKIIDEILENESHGVTKWGSAGCIELGRVKGMKRGERVFLFFGWAAE